MNNIKKKLMLTVAASAVMVALPSIADHVWGNNSGAYHWDADSLPVEISVIDSVTSDWQDEMDETINQWNVSTVLNLTVNSSDNNGLNCPTANGQMRICNAAYGTNGWLGLASLNIDSGNHILYATAQVNDSYSMTQDERNSVMCQEVGHLFGLDHTSTNGSSQDTCMDYSSNPSDGVWPNAHDFEMLEEIYAHIGDGGDPDPDPGECVSGDGELCNGVPETGISANRRREVDYHIHVPAGASNLSISISGGTGDADLYVNYGSQAQRNRYDCRPYLNGNEETCNMDTQEGDYHVMIRAYSTFSGVTLIASYDGGNANAVVGDHNSKLGRLVRSDFRGQLWIKNHSNNTKTITHIRLAGESNKAQ